MIKNTLIFGHKKPDTDSVTSAIGLSYLKNELGEKTEPRVLGYLNKETKFALKYFDIKQPEYLDNTKLQLRDVNYHIDFMIKEDDSIYNGYQMMLKEGQTGIPVTNSNGKFVGLTTIKDLSHIVVNDRSERLDTSYQNIIDVIDGEEVLKCSDEIVGNLIVAAYRSTTFMNSVSLSSEDILIVGDRHSIIEYAVESGVKLIIITGEGEIKDKHLEVAKSNNVSIIRSKNDTYMISRMMPLVNQMKTLIRSYNPTKFLDTDYVSDVVEINNKLKHTNYPIVDKKNNCLGLLRITDLSEKNPKRVILVDHNEKLQSVDGLEEAQILEIIDHHNLGSITTMTPINFRNMTVGSTCTIVYNMYLEKGIDIPRNIAGLLLSGILSDTLILKSPTATKLDIEAVYALSSISGVNYEDYGMELLKSGTSLKGMSKEDVLYNDFKLFNIGEKTFAVGQFFTMDFSEVEKEIDEYIEVLNQVCISNEYDFVGLYFTDIIRGGSYVLYNENSKNIMELAYNLDEVKQGFFVEGCVSRKKNVIPLLMDVMDN